jgi:hypothetical protein
MAAVLPMTFACGPNEEERAAQAAADSIAAARARGETDLSNPEMGGKMLVTLSDSGMSQSHTEMPAGQLSVAVQNKSTRPHTLQLKGQGGGGFKSSVVPPGGFVLMTVLIDPGVYDLVCPDSAQASACGSGQVSIR